MRRLRIAFAAGAVAASLALAALWLGRESPPAPPAAAPPSPNGVGRPPEPERRVTGSPASPPEPAPARPPQPSGRDSPRADAELAALEERALRRIDAVAMLEAEGIDPREFQRRGDADEVLRHLAGDEVLTLFYMRAIFGFRVYPRSQPRETVLREARATAEEIVARLTPVERKNALERELERPELPPPEPVYQPNE